jgi:hypothetical protein
MYIHYSCRIHVELKDGSRDPEQIGMRIQNLLISLLKQKVSTYIKCRSILKKN